MFERNENGKIHCNSLEIEVLIDDILENIKPENAHELQWCRNAIVEAVLIASGDYAVDNEIEEYEDAEYYGE